MSIEKKYFVIGGFDLTPYKTDKYEDWKWTDDGEEYLCNQCHGNIKLFDDLMSEEHLYLGYVFASGDQYCFDTVQFVAGELFDMMIRMQVSEKLLHLINEGVVSKDAAAANYKVIIFEECY
jgi:hypothetical protein